MTHDDASDAPPGAPPTPPGRAGPTAAQQPPAEPAALRWRLADAEFDEVSGILQVAGQPVDVEPRPLRLLAELLRHVDEVVTREELLDTVWFDRVTTDHVLASAVSKLRAALGPLAGERLVTVPRVGYRLQGPVQRLPAQPAGTALAPGLPVPGRPSFVLERTLGQGGSGDVWLARHATLGSQRVFKFAFDGRRLAALKREYTLYRVLQKELGPRPDIAVVLDANFQSAPYFLECEDGGLSLADWAAQGQRLQQMPQDERLALFLQIATAVAAAHGVGVLHKDLKPGNVLVSGEPGRWQARLTDFGSGRLLDPARLQALQVTALGLTHTQAAASDSRSGTLLYMAPEVLNGQAATVQSDVFALGLMLYQLTIGAFDQPFTTGWERRIADLLLRSDITAATEGQPADRLASVTGLIQRVASLPARRADAERAVELARAQERLASQAAAARIRRPWVVGALAGLCLGIAVSLWQLMEARRASAAALLAAKQAESVSAFLERDVLSTPDVVRLGASQPVLLNDILVQASANLEARFEGQPLIEAAVRQHLARAFARLGQTNEAWKQGDTAARLYASALPPDDPRALRQRYEHVVHWIELQSPELDEKREAYRRVLADTPPAVLADNRELRYAATRATAAVELALRNRDAAVAAARELVAMADAWQPPSQERRIEARSDLIGQLVWHGALDAASSALADLQSGPDRGNLAVQALVADAKWKIAAVHRDAKRFDEAERLLLQARDELLSAQAPSAIHLGYNASELGHLHRLQGVFVQAGEWYERAIALWTPVLGTDHQWVRITQINAADMLLEQGRYAQALAAYERHRFWFSKVATAGRFPPLEYGAVRSLVGLGKFDEALAVAQRFRDHSKNDSVVQRGDEQGKVVWAIALAGAGWRAQGQRLFDDSMRDWRALGALEWQERSLRREMRLALQAPSSPRGQSPDVR